MNDYIPLVQDGYRPFPQTRYGQVDEPVQRPLVVRYVLGPLEPQKQCKVPSSNFLNYDEVARGGSYLFGRVSGEQHTIPNKWGGAAPKPMGVTTVQRILNRLYGNTPVQGNGPGSIYNGIINTNVPGLP